MFFKRSKRKLALFCGAVLALTVLSACGKEPAPENETPALPEPEPEATAPAQPEIDPAARAAFQKVLIDYRENLILPHGMQLPEDLRSFGNIENNTFFIADVDEDGMEELVLEISEAPTAGMVAYVIGYDAASGEIVIELQEHCGEAFYPGGIATVIASHNQTMGELWPYAIFRHNPETDRYEVVGNVYAEDHDIMESYGDVNEYHYEADPNNTGTVYFVTDDLWYGKAVDIDGYNAWRETYIPAGTEPIDYERLTLTEEHIAAVTAE